MGFFGSKKSEDKNPDDRKKRSDQSSSNNVKRKASLKRRLSSNSMRKIREIAQCLKIIGDDLEEKRLSGKFSSQTSNQQKDG